MGGLAGPWWGGVGQAGGVRGCTGWAGEVGEWTGRRHEQQCGPLTRQACPSLFRDNCSRPSCHLPSPARVRIPPGQEAGQASTRTWRPSPQAPLFGLGDLSQQDYGCLEGAVNWGGPSSWFHLGCGMTAQDREMPREALSVRAGEAGKG